MKKLFTFLLLLMLVGAVAAAIAATASRKKFENMSDDEIREFLATKLEGKVSEEQVTSIQESVIAGVRARSGGGDHYVEDVEVNGDLFRRLIFTSNPNLTQSEAKIKMGTCPIFRFKRIFFVTKTSFLFSSQIKE